MSTVPFSSRALLMAYLKIKGDRRLYWVRDVACLGAECLALGLYQQRGAIGAAGTRNTGAMSATCMTTLITVALRALVIRKSSPATGARKGCGLPRHARQSAPAFGAMFPIAADQSNALESNPGAFGLPANWSKRPN